MEGVIYDAAVVGCGVVGACVARALSVGLGAKVVVLERSDDAFGGASGGNSAMLHTAFDASPHTLEARLMRQSRDEWQFVCGRALRDGLSWLETEEAGSRFEWDAPFPVRRCGAVVVAWTAEEAELLPLLFDRSQANIAHDVRLLDPAGVYECAPGLAPGAVGGLLVPGEAVVDAAAACLFFLHQALAAGARLRTGFRLESARWDAAERLWVVRGAGGAAVRARSVVNAAGCHADLVQRAREPAPAGGHPRFASMPRRGEFVVLRTPAALDRDDLPIVLPMPVPGRRTKGVLVWRSVRGELVAGPTAVDQPSREQPAGPVAAGAVRALRDAAERVYPAAPTTSCTRTRTCRG